MTKKTATKNSTAMAYPLGNPCSNDGVCPGMQMAMDGDEGSKTGGFSMVHLFSMTGAPTRSRVSYKPRLKKYPVIILTCCPFCKVNYDGLERQVQAKKAAKKAKKVSNVE